MTDQVGMSGLQFLGRFKNGQPEGQFWLGLINNGFIHGKVDKNGLGTGDDLAFIYPDGETVLRGQFKNLYMKKAKHVDVLKYGCDKNGLFIATQFSDPLNDYDFSKNLVQTQGLVVVGKKFKIHMNSKMQNLAFQTYLTVEKE